MINFTEMLRFFSLFWNARGSLVVVDWLLACYLYIPSHNKAVFVFSEWMRA